MAPLRGTALPACLAISLGLYLLPSAFVAPAPSARPAASVATARGQVALAARGGGEYDVSDADIQAFYEDRRRARGRSEKEKAFSEGGGTSQKPSRLLRGFFCLRGGLRGLLRRPPAF